MVPAEQSPRQGPGSGGALATLRYSLTDAATSITEVAQDLVGHVLALKGVIAVHIGVVDHEVTGVPTNEREIRQATNDDAFDVVLMVEGLGRRGLRGRPYRYRGAAQNLHNSRHTNRHRHLRP